MVNWLAATVGQAPQAFQINQFLTTHNTVNLYTAVSQAAQNVNGAAHTASNSLFMAQQFTTGAAQTTVGYVSLPLTANTGSGALLGPLTLSIFANSAGAPTGTALISVTATAEYTFSITAGVDTVYVNFPLPVSGLSTSTTYWLVTSPAGNVTNFFTWRRSNQASGASTSTNGTTWTAQTYGLQFSVFDQTASGNRLFTWEDGGLRWTYVTYASSTILPTYFAEYTAGQTAGDYLQSTRTLSYTANALNKVV